MKNQFGIATLECFPFTKKIGFTEHQIPLIEKCLQGVTTLKEALAQVDHTDYKEVGISNRFLKTAGFHTILIDWKASSSELVRFLSHRLNTEEQSEFLNKIRLLKKKIVGKGIVKEFYCSKEISNADKQGRALAQGPGPGTAAATHSLFLILMSMPIFFAFVSITVPVTVPL